MDLYAFWSQSATKFPVHLLRISFWFSIEPQILKQNNSYDPCISFEETKLRTESHQTNLRERRSFPFSPLRTSIIPESISSVEQSVR